MGVARALPSIAEAARRIEAGDVTPTSLVEAALERAHALNDGFHAFVAILDARAHASALTAEREIASGRRRGRLHGIPYALKDIYDVAGVPTTAHSKLLLDNVAQYDSAAVEKLEAAGMVLIGKTATHEFAVIGPAWDLPWPPARNPWNPAYFTGGSSSGSAAAVASGIVPMALGTDTGGSVRVPAAYCGCVGLKPTYGRVSRRGVVPASFSLDHCGPLTATVEDNALVLQALAGFDPKDPASSRSAVPDYLSTLGDGVAGLRIGYAKELDQEAGTGDEELEALEQAIECFRGLGAEVDEVRIPPFAQFRAAAQAIEYAESFSVHRRDLITRPGDYSMLTRERLMLGAFVSGAEYVQAQRLRRRLVARVDALFSEYDVLLSAPVPGPCARLDEVDTSLLSAQQPTTSVFNVTGHPALCEPCGFSKQGLPLSLQLAAAPFAEATLFRAAYAYEQATEWHARRPLELPGAEREISVGDVRA